MARIEGDDELKARLASHRRNHDTTWKLIEAPDKLAAALDPATLEGNGAVVLDRFTVWLSKHLEVTDKSKDGELLEEVAGLADPLYRSTTPAVVVTTGIELVVLARQRPQSPPDRPRRPRQPAAVGPRDLGGDDGQRRPLFASAEMPLIGRTFPVGALGCNCNVVACPDTRQALVIDPGDDAADVLANLGARRVDGGQPAAHACSLRPRDGDADVAAATGAEVLVHRDDRWFRPDADADSSMFGVRRADGQPWHRPTPHARADRGRGRDLRAAGSPRPSHPRPHAGSTCFFVDGMSGDGAEGKAEEPLLLAGDTLFAGSIGRTDLWGGSLPTIRNSIRQRLFTLPDDTLVIPGHGPPTTIAAERESNPFVKVV